MSNGKTECCTIACDKEATVEIRVRVGTRGQAREFRPFCESHKRKRVRPIP